MKELIEYIATSLVDDPTQVRVTQEQRGGKTFLKLQVAKEDMGRVIGKQGRIANAMRALLNVTASRTGKQIVLDVEDPQMSRSGDNPEAEVAAGSPAPGEPVFLAVGKLRRPHGVKGEMLMEVLTDFPERLKPGVMLYR